MTPERWRQIEEIFHAALEVDPDSREEFLRERSGGDEELHAQALNLLSQYDEASSFIEAPLYDSAKAGVLSSLLDDRDDDPMVGKTLGTYRVEREIGRGGMGAVYEAVRADGSFRMRAAIKIVKRGVDTDFVLRRFRNERQILATLEHPYITRLIDGGTTEDGRPYFVMDYIDGLALYRYCEKNRLSIRDRLQLFCRVCEAVEYAHQRLVIHRDLKPSNIIVTNDGTPRLLDFGIAKLLDPELASDTLQPTATALRMMTVDYASPEQVRGEKVTFATDVYSLGVILFELLTGFRPYVLTSRAPHDVAKAICDDDAVAPSVALTDTDSRLPVNKLDSGPDALEKIAEQRAESVEGLVEAIRGNLDNITLKALRKDPGERYSSVADLRADVERHLEGKDVASEFQYPSKAPVPLARPAEGSKLVAVLPLSLLSPSGAGNTDEAYLTIGLADAIITRLTSVRQLTVRPTSSITRYNEGPVNPLRAGVELGVDFVLDGRIRRFGHRIRISLQLLDVSRATAIWAGQFDEDLTDVLELEDAISEQVAAALIPHLTGEEKQKLAKRGTDDPAAYEAYLKGRFYWNQFTAQSLPKAIESFKHAIDLDPNYAMAHVGISDFYLWANIYGLLPVSESYELAGNSIRRALEIDKNLGEAYASLGLIVQNQFRYEEAEKLYQKAIQISPNYPLVHEWYSALLVGTGRRSEGLAEIRRAEVLDPLSLRCKTLVTWTYYQCGDFESALAKAEEIIALDANYPQGHLQRGYVLCELGRAAEAVVSIEHALRLMPGSALAQCHLCFGLAAAGRRAEALNLAREMKRLSASRYVKPMFLCMSFAAAGDMDEAFRYLEIAVRERDPWLCWLGTDAKLAGMRADPRFEALYNQTRSPAESSDGPIHFTDPSARTSVGFADTDTMIGSEMPTLAYKQSFLRRHAGMAAAAAIVLVVLLGLFASGVLELPFRGSMSTPASTSQNFPRKIAVLPFENATGDASNDYLSDGISELLISRLSEAPGLRVTSRSSTFGYKGKNVDAVEVGSRLQVDTVVTGSVQKRGDIVTFQTEARRVPGGERLFTLNFTEPLDRLVRLQEIMASRVLDRLELPLEAKAGPPKSYTEDNDAFQLYLQAEFHRQKGTPADTQAAIDLYQKALQFDPNYALAYQGLAFAYRSAPAYGALPPQESYPKAKDAAQRALDLDPALSGAYVTLASVKATYDWDFADAEKQYKEAIRLGPNSAESHYSYANFLVAMGRVDEGLTEYRIAQQIDPLSLNIATNIGWALYIAGRYDEAATEVKQVIAKEPTFARAYMNLGEIAEEQEKYDEAIGYFQKAKDLSKDPLSDMAIGHALAAAGRKAEAQRVATDLEEKVREKQVSPFLPAVVYAGMNEKDKAFYWLERAYQERSNWLTLIKVGRRMKNLRGDPRFDDLINRIGFRDTGS